jgi:hypothetical protein
MSDEQLSKMLTDGWNIEGNSTTIMAAGAMTHSILLQKENKLESVTIVVNAGREVGRQSYRFARG